MRDRMNDTSGYLILSQTFLPPAFLLPCNQTLYRVTPTEATFDGTNPASPKGKRKLLAYLSCTLHLCTCATFTCCIYSPRLSPLQVSLPKSPRTGPTTGSSNGERATGDLRTLLSDLPNDNGNFGLGCSLSIVEDEEIARCIRLGTPSSS